MAENYEDPSCWRRRLHRLNFVLGSEAGFEVVVYDDLSTGHAWAAPPDALIKGSILDYELLLSL